MNSFDLVNHPPSDTIKLLSNFIDKVVWSNNYNPSGRSPENLTSFHARSIPTIDTHAYLTRILKYCPCSNECFIALVIYFQNMIDNAKKKQAFFSVDPYSIHRLLISGIMLSSKFFSDIFFTNSRYAKVGGLPISELNNLEVEFLILNNFNLYVTTQELKKTGNLLLSFSINSTPSKSLPVMLPTPPLTTQPTTTPNRVPKLFSDSSPFSHHSTSSLCSPSPVRTQHLQSLKRQHPPSWKQDSPKEVYYPMSNYGCSNIPPRYFATPIKCRSESDIIKNQRSFTGIEFYPTPSPVKGQFSYPSPNDPSQPQINYMKAPYRNKSQDEMIPPSNMPMSHIHPSPADTPGRFFHPTFESPSSSDAYFSKNPFPTLINRPPQPRMPLSYSATFTYAPNDQANHTSFQ